MNPPITYGFPSQKPIGAESILTSPFRSFLIDRYRKPPEHIYPAALNDCVKATKYFMKNGRTYGIEPTRIALAGGFSKYT